MEYGLGLLRPQYAHRKGRCQHVKPPLHVWRSARRPGRGVFYGRSLSWLFSNEMSPIDSLRLASPSGCQHLCKFSSSSSCSGDIIVVRDPGHSRRCRTSDTLSFLSADPLLHNAISTCRHAHILFYRSYSYVSQLFSGFCLRCSPACIAPQVCTCRLRCPRVHINLGSFARMDAQMRRRMTSKDLSNPDSSGNLPGRK